jgi:hypothetical protein
MMVSLAGRFKLKVESAPSAALAATNRRERKYCLRVIIKITRSLWIG